MNTAAGNDETEGAAAQEDEGHFPGEKRSKWSEYRAIIVKKPDSPILAQVGEVVLVALEVQNQTKWPWKQGCVLMASPKQSAALQGIIINPVAIDCEVRGLQTLKLDFPIQITEQFQAQQVSDASDSDLRKVYLSFCGPKGNVFGQEILVELRVQLKKAPLVSQEELFRAALHMAETMNLGSFDACVEALKKCGGDQNKACQQLIDKN